MLHTMLNPALHDDGHWTNDVLPLKWYCCTACTVPLCFMHLVARIHDMTWQ
jgi:hypothetical protein